jgi:signal transduction histidine kinase
MSANTPQSKADLARLFITAVLVPIFLAAAASAWLAWQVARISDATAWIDRSDRVIALAGEVHELVVDEELGVSAYLVSPDPAFLERFKLDSPTEELSDLAQLVQGEPEQAAAVELLRERYAAWRDKAQAAILAPPRDRAARVRQAWADLDDLRSRSADITTRAKATRLEHMRWFERRTERITLYAACFLALVAGGSALASQRNLASIAALRQREREALATAHEALRAKDTFLANLSHELRTPLTPILAWAKIMRSKRLAGAELDRALASIERNAEAQAHIVDDILDVSRIATGKLLIAREEVRPESVVRAALEVVELSAQAKGITVVARFASKLPPIVGDPVRLQQVTWNLLSNAVKFTPRGGRVELVCDVDDGGVRIQVTDDGIGIAPEFLPHVFEYFRQEDASVTRAHGGLGLGLAIVKHLVELHGGVVRAASEGPGRGATFTVIVPAAH